MFSDSRACLVLTGFVLIATALRIEGAPLIAEGLDPAVFGSVHDVSTRRVVNTGEDLQAYLTDVTVTTLLVNGKSSRESSVTRWLFYCFKGSLSLCSVCGSLATLSTEVPQSTMQTP